MSPQTSHLPPITLTASYPRIPQFPLRSSPWSPPTAHQFSSHAPSCKSSAPTCLPGTALVSLVVMDFKTFLSFLGLEGGWEAIRIVILTTILIQSLWVSKNQFVSTLEGLIPGS